jgi:hypothetical protein
MSRQALGCAANYDCNGRPRAFREDTSTGGLGDGAHPMQQKHIPVKRNLKVGFESQEVWVDSGKVGREACSVRGECREGAPGSQPSLMKRFADSHPDDTVRMVAKEVRPIGREVSLLDNTTRVVVWHDQYALGTSPCQIGVITHLQSTSTTAPFAATLWAALQCLVRCRTGSR